APRDVQIPVDDDAVLLLVADAGIGADEPEDRREARVADERADLLREDGREREALEERRALLVPAEEERDAVHARAALRQPLARDPIQLGRDHRDLVRRREAREVEEPVTVEERALLVGDGRPEGETGGERRITHGRPGIPQPRRVRATARAQAPGTSASCACP